MAYWGIAYSSGCNYNKPWEAFDPEDAQRSVTAACDAAQEALSRRGNVSAFEKALISALPYRYPAPAPTEDMSPWNDDFANAMRQVYAEFSDDLEVATLFGEAIMNRTPWAGFNVMNQTFLSPNGFLLTIDSANPIQAYWGTFDRSCS